MRSPEYMGREVEIKVDDTVLVVRSPLGGIEWLLGSGLTAPKASTNFQTSVIPNAHSYSIRPTLIIRSLTIPHRVHW